MTKPIAHIDHLEQQREDGFRVVVSNWTIYPGKSYGITGPNGSGKTSLLRMLAFLDTPTQGAIRFEGSPDRASDRWDSPSTRRRVTFVAQNAFLFRSSVFDNVAYGLLLRQFKSESIASHVAGALKKVGLSGFEARNAWQLSGGEAQRVALARALALEPDLLLLDEPTANVDAENASLIEAALIETRDERQMAIVFSSHQMDQAYRLADEVKSLRDGRLLEAGPTNLFQGEVASDGTAIRLSPELVIQAVTDRSGRVYAHIPPEDIVVSRQPIVSSARNSFGGTITAASVSGAHIDLVVDIGVRLDARITKVSFSELELTVGVAVFATFKSSSVQVL